MERFYALKRHKSAEFRQGLGRTLLMEYIKGAVVCGPEGCVVKFRANGERGFVLIGVTLPGLKETVQNSTEMKSVCLSSESFANKNRRPSWEMSMGPEDWCH